MKKIKIIMMLLVINFQTLAGEMNGNYVIGPEPSDYNDLTAAVNDLLVHGMGGPVNMLIKPGNYDTHITIDAITRLGDTDDILTITSMVGNQPAVLFHDAVGLGDNWVIQLNGSSYITISNLVLEAQGTSEFSKIIDIQPGSSFIHFGNNVFNNYVPNMAATNENSSSLVADDVSGVNHVVVENNQFINGSRAIFLSGIIGSSIVDLEVRNNIFSEQSGSNGEYVVSLNVIDDLLFNSNLIINNESDAKGVDLLRITGGEVDGNEIIMMGTGVGNVGMRMIFHNAIGSEDTLVTNNFIRSTRQGVSIAGGNKRIKMYHNTIFNTAFDSVVVASHAIKVSSTDNEDLEFLNNMILNKNDHALGMVMEIEDSTGVLVSNFNVFKGTPLMTFDFRIDSVDFPALADYQASTTLDGQSIEKGINFVNAASGDLHLTESQFTDPDIMVTPLLEVTHDIDNELRPLSSVLMGADDFFDDVIFADNFE